MRSLDYAVSPMWMTTTRVRMKVEEVSLMKKKRREEVVDRNG